MASDDVSRRVPSSFVSRMPLNTGDRSGPSPVMPRCSISASRLGLTHVPFQLAHGRGAKLREGSRRANLRPSLFMLMPPPRHVRAPWGKSESPWRRGFRARQTVRGRTLFFFFFPPPPPPPLFIKKKKITKTDGELIAYGDFRGGATDVFYSTRAFQVVTHSCPSLVLQIGGQGLQ